MRTIALVLMLLQSASGVAAERALFGYEGRVLSVETTVSYYWPQSVTYVDDEGSSHQIDTFPMVTALVVRWRDGVAMEAADEAIARGAAEAFCQQNGQGEPGSAARLADGAWAFPTCADTEL